MPYEPAFYLPERKLFVEITPSFPYIEDMASCGELSKMGFSIVLLPGEVDLPFGDEALPCKHSTHCKAARGLSWNARGERLAGDFVWVCDEDGSRVRIDSVVESKDRRAIHSRLCSAFLEAAAFAM